jgi:hypothetical protein
MSRRRAVLLGVGAAVLIFLLADAFIAPPAHDVHSPGGIPAKVMFFESDQNVWWDPTPPSQSLADMKCGAPSRATTCDASVVATDFPNLTQTPQTLYLVWAHCSDWSGHGEITPWDGSNIEYVPSSRQLVIHCYRAKPWLYAHQYLYGVAGTGRWALLSVSTAGIGTGTITILEDDHLEHLVGDQSDEYQLATATIS